MLSYVSIDINSCIGIMNNTHNNFWEHSTCTCWNVHIHTVYPVNICFLTNTFKLVHNSDKVLCTNQTILSSHSTPIELIYYLKIIETVQGKINQGFQLAISIACYKN